MAMSQWTVKKSYRNATARSQEARELAAEKYSARVANKTNLVAAYRLGFNSPTENYGDTYRERKDLNDMELLQFQAGFYAKSHQQDSEF